MKIPKILGISISLALLVSSSVFGATIKVPDDYATIQAAIDAAVDGDTVLVASGTYTGPINFNGKKITVRSAAGPDLTIINTTFFIQLTNGETEETVLEGFKIIGGIDIFGSSPQIKTCNLIGVGSHGTGGHGSIGSGSSPTFIDCKINGGQAGVGGGYDVRGNSSATFIDCEFSNNEAGSNGGALYINNSTVSLEKCTFLQNTAGVEGGAISVTGSSTLSISFCNFSENSAHVGGGILNGYDDNTTISNSIFTKNTSEKWGGAIFANASTSFKTENCIFIENNANWHGGAIHINWSASPAITNSIFDANIAGGGGGAIWIQPGSFSNISNCTFFKNNAGWRGGAILNSGSNPTISNSILWKDNAPVGPEIGEYKNTDPDPKVNHCIIQGDYPGEGNIDADPLFIDPENGDFHLQYISPCIDLGTNDAPGLALTDLDGKPRIINDNVDMGAYESELTNINNHVTFKPDPVTYLFSPDTEGCQAGAVGKFSFDAILNNTNEEELSDLIVEVDGLTNNNFLLTDDELIDEGGRFEVPEIDDYADGVLAPEELVDVPFEVCLQNKNPFRLFVNVLGTALTPIKCGGGEPCLLEPDGILDTLYGLENIKRINDDVDQIWKNLNGGAKAVAKFAGATQELGFLDSNDIFNSVFTVTGNGFDVSGEGDLPSSTILPIFRWVTMSNGLFSSKPSDNSDSLDHMVTWLITDGPSKGSYVLGWEDLPGLGDRDYQDLAVEITNAIPIFLKKVLNQ